jgi:hypothetical protein
MFLKVNLPVIRGLFNDDFNTAHYRASSKGLVNNELEISHNLLIRTNKNPQSEYTIWDRDLNP